MTDSRDRTTASLFREPSPRADGPRLSHARLACRGRGRGAGCVSALACGRPCRDRGAAPLSRHGGDAAMSRSDEIGEGAARSVSSVNGSPSRSWTRRWTQKPPSDLAHDLSVALMLVLERLSPLERASFLLHDVFGLDFAEVGRALDRGEAACRQLAARARGISKRAARDSPLRRRRGAAWPWRLPPAVQSGDTGALMKLLAEDAVLYTGRRRQARRGVQSDLWRGKNPSVPRRHRPQESGTTGDAATRRYRKRARRFRDARRGWVDRYHGVRTSRRPHRRHLSGAQS